MSTEMAMVNIHEAKTNLSKIVDEVKKLGKPMLIAKAGKPQVKIVPLEQPEISTRFGFMAEPTNIPDNFDQIYVDEIQALFEGSSK